MLLLCDKNRTQHCKEKSDPYYPGQTVLFYFPLDDNIIKKTARIKHNGNWCELRFLITPDPLQIFPEPWKELDTILLRPGSHYMHPQKFCQCDPILSSHIPSLI